jgi:hypothetical protein
MTTLGIQDDADRAFAHEGPDLSSDVLLWGTPKYKLDVQYDQFMNQTTARLLVQRAPDESWRCLDDQVIGGSSQALAVFWLRENRRRARGYA